ncbi:MAG: ferredoxin--NADP reductase [Bdellovibrionales bacterium]|nr:ferredoxin--NADP reductase [Bdellovibrionales bacterium]
MKKESTLLRPALRFYPIKVKQKIQETKDSVSFVFEVSKEHKELFYYTPAQFLTFEFQIKEENFLRSYSLSSCPLLNEDLKTTVKRVKDGIVSNYMIDFVKVGDTLLSRKPAGRFFKPPTDLKPKHYFLFAGGSGITPLFSIIKTVLLSDSQNKVSLFYANRDSSSIIYYEELQDLLFRYKERFNIIHILSQSTKVGYDIYGRLKKEHLEKYFSNKEITNPSYLYYLCGPLNFMQMVQDFLIHKQVKRKNIRKESFFSASSQIAGASRTDRIIKPLEEGPLENKTHSRYEEEPERELAKPPSKDKDLSRQEKGFTDDSLTQPEVLLSGKQGESEKADPKVIKACINEEVIEISAQMDIPILEQLLSAGYSPPFSCLSGSCMSCLAVLNKGRIRQEERGILEDENLKNHEILTCQAKPESLLVEVDYDNV